LRIISEKPLREFWLRHPDAEQPLLTWIQVVESQEWDSPSQIRDTYRTASVVSDNRVVFNLKGNDYRLIVWVNYGRHLVYIKWIGTHSEYDRIDVSSVGS